MPIRLKVDLRVRIMRKLISDLDPLKLAINWVDNEARDQLRRSMITWIDSMYWVDEVRYVLNRYNDLVEGIDYVDAKELDRLFPAGLPAREAPGGQDDL